jgi:tetratricopeptide (TPR) repeat protein
MARKTQIIGLTLLICTLLLGGCNPFRKGRKAYPPRVDEDEKTPAEQKKTKLLKQIDRKFENPQAHFELGRLYQADGMWAQAEQEYKTALNFDPAHRQAQAARIKVLIAIGDKTKAELLADEYISQVSISAAGSLKLASAFQEQKLDEYALACYRQALHLAPNSAKVNRQVGYYYLSRNDKVSAEEYLSRSFDLNWNQPDVAAELGRLGVPIKIPPKARKSTNILDRITGLFKKKKEP